MALTPSNMMPLGTVAPDFTLPDTISGKMMTLNDVKSETATVVMFICNHCPYVIHVQDELARLAKDYNQKEIGFVGISSNDVINYPADSPEQMKVQAEKIGYTFPYLYDASQNVAKDYLAACTPDLYVFDKDLKCVYRGRLDDSSPGNGKPVTGSDIRIVLDALLAGKSVQEDQIPSLGCNIKWK